MGQIEILYNKHKSDMNMANKSMSWFNAQAKSIGNIHADAVLREGGRQTKRLVPGNMYMFYYNPKGRDTLPYWDAFPMVIPYDTTENGFIGLNLHYLPVYYRVKLLDALMKYTSNDKLNANTKIQYSWSIVKSFSQTKLALPCIKRYIGGRVMSNFVKISPENWFSACMIPSQRFKKATAEQVWRDSLR